MRPFKFFFMASMAIILLFALAKVALFAFVMAAIMSVGFFVLKKIKSFFRHLDWDDEDHPRRRRTNRVGIGFNESRSFSESWDHRNEYSTMPRNIYVH